MIEEIRILTGSLGRSIPQALFEVGRRGPDELRPAFDAAHREWLLSTDFARTLDVLKDRLADPTADATCETLLVAHELGGADLDRRLAALAEDRVADTQGRKDARAKQAGVRFARRFVLIVPVGHGPRRDVGRQRAGRPTGAPLGQIAVVVAARHGCWRAGSGPGAIMRLPDEERVFQPMRLASSSSSPSLGWVGVHAPAGRAALVPPPARSSSACARTPRRGCGAARSDRGRCR